jgi:hypothetical protein
MRSISFIRINPQLHHIRPRLGGQRDVALRLRFINDEDGYT